MQEDRKERKRRCHSMVSALYEEKTRSVEEPAWDKVEKWEKEFRARKSTPTYI
jgi:hypothetical protein